MRDLLKVPPELRFQIYEILGTPEKLKMMETCRLTCKEMIPVIDREATYHLFVNYPAGKGRRSKLPFREHHGEEIRNVEIRWSLPDVRTTWDYINVQSMHACRWVPTISRKHCSMTFECDPSKATFMKQFIFEALRMLAMFETLLVRVVPHESSEAAGRDTFSCNAIARAFRGLVYALREQVVSILGPLVEASDKIGQFARYKPCSNNGDRQNIVTPSPVYAI